MNKNNFCIATISWARNEAEEKLLTESLQQLATLNVPVYITDGGSTNTFLSFVKSIPHFTFLTTEGKGVFAQAKNSLVAAQASSKPFILYTEPDKKIFFQNSLLQFLDAVFENESLGIHLASRSATSFASFPRFQQMTEATINNCCEEIIGKDADYTYGPFLLNSKLIPYVNLVNEDIGWGWRPYLFTVAHRLGLEVNAFAGEFACPPDQREDDQKERIYRMRQLEQNIRGIVLATSVSL